MNFFKLNMKCWLLIKVLIFFHLMVIFLLNYYLNNQTKISNITFKMITNNTTIETIKVILALNITKKNTSLSNFIDNENLNAIIRNKHFIKDKLIKESKQKNKYVSNLLVILIQVHSRLNYLKELVSSLNETKHINETLVIFSHDLIDEKINDFIKTIDFCAVLQIYYPYSLQIYPNEFPGKDPNDCPIKIGKKKY
jgi:hypothetical protein